MTRYLSQVTISITRHGCYRHYFGLALGAGIHDLTRLEAKRVETPERIAAVEARMLARGYALMDDDGAGFRWYQRLTDDGALAAGEMTL